MQKTMNCFLSYQWKEATLQTIQASQASPLTERIFLLAAAEDPDIELPDRCQWLPVASVNRCQDQQTIANATSAKYTLLYISPHPLQAGIFNEVSAHLTLIYEPPITALYTHEKE